MGNLSHEVGPARGVGHGVGHGHEHLEAVHALHLAQGAAGHHGLDAAGEEGEVGLELAREGLAQGDERRPGPPPQERHLAAHGHLRPEAARPVCDAGAKRLESGARCVMQGRSGTSRPHSQQSCQ